MTTSTLSPKNQTTLNVDFVRKLNLRAGAKFRQTLKDGRIILEPIPDVMTAFGALKSKRKFGSIQKETEEMEKAVGKAVGQGRRT